MASLDISTSLLLTKFLANGGHNWDQLLGPVLHSSLLTGVHHTLQQEMSPLFLIYG